jgi:Pyridine nucleotide-disulphide oxidoreductase, dimerisation domain
LAAEVHVDDMNNWFSARTYAETVAWSKVILDRANNRILGAHFVGHAGHELVTVFGLAMKFGISASALRENIYAYPTFASDIKHMLGQRLRCIARRYRLNSQPAFPEAKGLRDADGTAGQLFGAATSSKETSTCSMTSQPRAGFGKL